MPLPHNGYCPSHQHLAETEEQELAPRSRRSRRRRGSARPIAGRRQRIRRVLLGVDVGGTFTDAVLAVDGRLVTAKAPTTPGRPVRGRARRGPAGARARRQRATSRRSRTARPSPPTRCSRAAARARRSSPPRASPTSSSSAARRRQTSTGCAPRTRRRSCRPSAASARPSGWARRRARPLEDLGARMRACRARAGGGRRLPAARRPPPAHERAIGDALAPALPDVHVSLSHEVVGTFREYERAATTEVDAALSPLLAALPAPRWSERCGGGPARPDDHAVLGRPGRRRARAGATRR